MDTVSMLNTMRFYCQPILPLVYDESMSYYETLCKVVGQLNTTGETVNKLNEGLTGEISDRQAADAALDARIKEIEETNGKLHFLKFDGANPSGAMPTRSELYNWVRNGDAIYTLFSTNESGRGQVYAASCTYNAGNWGSEASNDFSIIVPIETKYDSSNDYAISQKIAKLTIPSASQPSLNTPWGLEIIEINTPSTTAEGVVNVTAVVSDSGSVNCSITPSEFLQLYNMTRGGKNLCVAVNAKLAYDGLARSSSIATVDTSNRIVRIAFERDSGTAITNGVNQLTKTLDYIIGDAKTGAWVHETIDSKIFDFNRYEGFQFTRGTGNVITTDADSTPSAVYSYYGDQSGKLYQNLPTRLIDEVDNAEYWNGVFDSYTDGHITFTFITANYATIGESMVVRVIELSSTKAGSVWTGGEKWSYAAKEFEVPYRPTSYVLDVWQASDTPTVVNGFVSYDGASSLDFDDLLPLVEGHQEILATLHKGTSSTGLEWSGLAYSSKLVNDGVGSITFATLEGVTLANGIPSMHGIVVFSKDSRGVKNVVITFSSALPAPNPDGSDSGKVPTVNGTAWELKTPTGGGSSDAVLYTAQTLTSPQQVQARKNIGALGSVSPNIKSLMIITPQNEADGIGVALSARGTGGNFTLDIADANEGNPTKLMGVKTPTDAETNAAANVEYVKNAVSGATGGTVDAVMSDTSTNAVQNKVIKKYVDDSAAKKLNQTEPVIKDGVTLESGSFQIYAQPNGQTSATGEEFASLNFSDNSPEGTGAGIVISGLANFGDAEAVGLEDTAVSYAQLLDYTKPLLLTYDNNQVTGASYTEIRKAIERGRQIKLAVANMPDVIATNAKNETGRSVLSFLDTSVGSDTVDFTQYSVTAQASGITVNVKSMQLP